MTDSCPVEVPETDFDHHSREMAYNPWPRWAELRAGTSLHHTAAHGGYYVAARYQDICEMARNTDVFSSAINQTSIPMLAAPPRPPISYDPPDTHFYRMIVNPLFTPEKVKVYEPWIRELAAGYIRPLLKSDGFNVAREVGLPVTRDVIMRIMGMVNAPIEVNAWADDMLFPNNEQQAAANMMAFLKSELDKRRANPGEDVMSEIIKAQRNGRGLTDQEQQSMALLIFMAGLDTTSFAISGTIWYMLQHPELKQQLRDADEAVWRLATDELVRWVTPAPNIGRTARVDTEVGGCPMHAGERVLMLYGSANRDPTEFKDPDKIILDRFPNRHLGFGMGPHRCLGSHLAKAVMQIVLKEILVGIDDFEIADPDAVRWESASVRGIKSLPVVRKRH